jgi:hypothetical protein
LKKVFDLKYKSLSLIPLKNFGYPITKLDSFSIQPGPGMFWINDSLDLKQVEIKEDTFVLDFMGYAHFHFIYDKLLQYEFIKQYVPELKISIVATKGYLDQYKNLISELMDIYNISNKNIIAIDEEIVVSFEKAYFILPTHNSIFSDYFEKVWFDPWKRPDDFKFYIEKARPLLLKSFKGFISTKKENNKIFISRYKQNNKVVRDNTKERFISMVDELKLEAFFKNIGYKIIYSEDFGLKDQVSIYSSASHIASLKASGLVNIIFANDGAKVTAINVDDRYQIWYDYIAKHSNLDFLALPEIIINGSAMSYFEDVTKEIKHFSFLEIKESLEKNVESL